MYEYFFCIYSCLWLGIPIILLLFVKKILVDIQMHHILFQFHYAGLEITAFASQFASENQPVANQIYI